MFLEYRFENADRQNKNDTDRMGNHFLLLLWFLGFFKFRLEILPVELSNRFLASFNVRGRLLKFSNTVLAKWCSICAYTVDLQLVYLFVTYGSSIHKTTSVTERARWRMCMVNFYFPIRDKSLLLY